ncbi:MAG: zinc-dependent metalloprotease [Bacteroidota bacterium]
MRVRLSMASALVLVLSIAGCTSFKSAEDLQAEAATTQKPPQRPAPTAKPGDMKPYSDVITDEAESDAGLFTTHRIGTDLYYEIPDSLLGTELLLVTRIAQTAQNIGYGGEKANTQIVRWERNGDDVLLRVVQYQNVADEDQPIYEAVRNSNFEPIVESFGIKALNEDSTGVVIDVTKLFTTDVPLLGMPQRRREAYRVRRLDAGRSFVSSAKSFPQNIEVRNVLTYEASDAPSNASAGSISLEMNHSMIMLPADPMTPRLHDPRVGFFSVQQTDYGRDAQRAERRRYITRWRLEPKDPEAFARGELVEPVKPIVYYIDPATPEKWRPFLKQGVDDWNVAFEAAGFKNAIMAKDPPTPEEDPEFSPEDVRYSVIRYFSSDIQNAYGPHVHDPRTGEILESDIGWYHNVMNLLRNWFFIQTAAANPDARGVEFDDDVMGELIRFVSAHEVGHTIGLPHNFGSSYAYPVDSLRSPTFTAAHGTAPSIMDYARFNYVAQPGDGVTNFYPRIGEYDIYSVMWGYRPVLDAETADAERETLNSWVKQREDDPRYFFGRQTSSRIDPRSQNEDLGDNAVLASTYGLRNLERIVPMLIEWTSRDATAYDDLDELYGQVVGQWNRYLGHVTRQVGGVYETYKTYDQEGSVYEFTPEETQREAMDFLAEYAFSRPDWLLNEDVIGRIEGVGVMERVRRLQTGVVNMLLDPQRLARLIEAEARMGDETYTPAEMLTDLRGTLFSELRRGEAIDPFRRNLQRGYVEQLHELMTEELEMPRVPRQFLEVIGFTAIDVSQSDIRAYVRGELRQLKRDVQRASARSGDRMTRLHLEDLEERIDAILDPN